MSNISSLSPSESVIAPTARRESRRLGWIDTTRGLAAILVVLHHHIATTVTGDPSFLVRSFGRLPTDVFEHDLDLGVLGVALFFFISGYIVPVSAMPASSRPLSRFWVSRFFRLYPAYWLSVGLAAPILGARSLHTLVNFTMLQRFVGMPDILGLYWTLQVELLFYCLIALLLFRRLLDKPWVSVICAFTFLALSGGLAAVRYYVGLKAPLAPTVGLSLMFAGNFWFWFSYKRAFTVRQAGMFYGCFMLCLYAVAYLGYHRDWGYGEQPSRFIVTYSLALLLFLSMSRIVKQGSPALLYLGAISYSLYLFHELVMFTLWERLGPYADGWLRIAICTAISVAAAGISFRLIECPGIAMGKRIINRNGWNTRTAAIPGV